MIYRDEHLLAVDKPSGMLVHRGWGRAPVVLVDIVKELAGQEIVHPVHRLDRGTSGVVLFALQPRMARSVTRMFQRRLVTKDYLALVRGRAPDQVTIDHDIPRRPDGPRVPAVTEVRRLHTAETHPRHVSLVHAAPRTGRFHQVRRHLKHIDHPLIGDTSYGKGRLNRAFTNRYGLQRLALHAFRLRLVNSANGEPLDLRAPLPPDLLEPLRRMGFPDESWSQVAPSVV